MDTQNAMATYAKKAAILGKILANYRVERQALLKKDPLLFKKILHERAKLVEDLRQLPKEPSPKGFPPFLQLQKKQVDELIGRIQTEREHNNGLFPHY